MKKLILLLTMSFMASHAQADLIKLNLIGTAGAGILPGNEPGTVTGGTGGEIAGTNGITYDTVSNVLDLTNVGWGGSRGFVNMTSAVSNSHLHGSTASANGSGFTQTATVLLNLTRSSSLAEGGVFTNPIIDFDTVFGPDAEVREAQLLNGQIYINIHTTQNPGGEARGFIVREPLGPEIEVQARGVALVDGDSRQSFGTALVGQSGRVSRFTIKNTGTSALKDLAILVGGANPGDYSFTPLTRTGLAPGASTSFKVTFMPSAGGIRRAILQIKSNDLNENPFDIVLGGSGAILE